MLRVLCNWKLIFTGFEFSLINTLTLIQQSNIENAVILNSLVPYAILIFKIKKRTLI